MSADASFSIRQAEPGDLDRILDLLTEYDLPRWYFEPYYQKDPTYLPGHGWLLEENGEVLSFLRIYDRSLTMGDAALRIAGVGNVITARAARGRGLAGHLLRASLKGIAREGYPYSLLWTHLPELYGRYGWSPIQQQILRAELSPVQLASTTITPFVQDDLAEVEALYALNNAGRAGPTIRDRAYWEGQLAWLQEQPGSFLVARRERRLIGYVRSRTHATEVEVLELGLAAGELEVGRALLSRVAAPRQGHVRAHLPPSLESVLPAETQAVATDTELMGRTIHVERLLQTFLPLWKKRAAAAGLSEGTAQFSTAAGAANLRVAGSDVQIVPRAGSPAVGLTEKQLAHLLFHGFDSAAEIPVRGAEDEACLRALFPPQDFVIWPSDAF